MYAAVFPPMSGVMLIPPIIMSLLAVGVAYIIPLLFWLFMEFPLGVPWLAVFIEFPCWVVVLVVLPHATSKMVSSNISAISLECRRVFMDPILLQCLIICFFRC